MNYNVADFIIQIKNASLARRKKITMPHSKMKLAMGRVMVRKGYLEDIKEEMVDGWKVLTLGIKYEKRDPVVTDVEILSKPSLRKYTNVKKIAQGNRRGMGLSIVSTSLGIMTGEEARRKGVGGELLFKVW